MTFSKLDQAAQEAGIAVDFTNANGERVRISDDTKTCTAGGDEYAGR